MPKLPPKGSVTNYDFEQFCDSKCLSGRLRPPGADFCSFWNKIDTISGHFGPYLDIVRDHCRDSGEGIFGNSCTKRWRSIWPVWRRTNEEGGAKKEGPQQMEPEGSTHISQWGAFGGLRCNAARRLRFAAPREGERWRVKLVLEPFRFRLPGGSPRPLRVIRQMTPNRPRNRIPKKAENGSKRPPPGDPLGTQFRS